MSRSCKSLLAIAAGIFALNLNAQSGGPTPVVANGLQIWFRADLGLTVSSSNVSGWLDQSGNNIQLTQSLSSAQPILSPSAFNGQPAVGFNGSGMLQQQAPFDIFQNSNDVSVFVVIAPQSGQTMNVFDYNSNLTLSQTPSTLYQYQLFWNYPSLGSLNGSAVTLQPGVPQLYEAVKSGAETQGYLNGVIQSDVTIPGGNAPLLTGQWPFMLGAAVNGQNIFNGHVAELLVYNRAVTDSEREAIETQLIAKYVPADANGNGIPDSWEMQYLGNLSHAATDDPGSVGRTLLQSYQRGLSPWPAPVVANGLQAWYRADVGVQADSNNNVSDWTDLSGNGAHLQQPLSYHRPTLVAAGVNGGPAVLFEQQFMASTRIVNPLNGANDATFIAVILPDSTQSNSGILFDLNRSGTAGLSVGLSGNLPNVFDMVWMDPAGGYDGYTNPIITNLNQVQLLEFEKSGTTETGYLNGSTAFSAAVPQAINSVAGPIGLGAAAAGNIPFDGQIAEVLVYNRALSDSERQQIEAQLSSKYIPADSNNNGIPDAWEMQYLGNLSHAATDDPGGVGRTLLQSYQQGLSPWPAPVVSTGLQAWYRADEGIVADSNGNISQWTDISGHGAHVQQVIPQIQPLLQTTGVNGGPAIQFEQKSLISGTFANPIAGSNDISLIAVVEPDASSNQGAILDVGRGTNNGAAIQLDGDVSFPNAYCLTFFEDNAGDFVSGGGFDLKTYANQVQLVEFVKSGSSENGYLNGALSFNRSVPSTLYSAPALIGVGGSNRGGGYFYGKITELLVYNRALSDSERQQIETHLTSKYVPVDSNSNGIPDTWEMQYLGNLSHAATDDPGGVGRTLLQSYQQGISPWPSPVVANGLQAWYRADEGVVADSNNNVSQWTDLSGNAVHVVQPVSGQQPLLSPQAMNGQPGLSFNGSSSALMTQGMANLFQNSNDETVVFVMNPSPTQTGSTALFGYGQFLVTQYGSETDYFTNNWLGSDSNGYSSDPVATTPGIPQVFEMVKSGQDEKAYINGALKDDSSYWWGPAPLSTGLWPVSIGCYNNQLGCFNGQIAEVLIYNRALSDPERQQLEQQLVTKYVPSDSNNNGIPDTWELQYLGNLSHAATDDPGGVGRTLLQSYQQGLSPWSSPVVASGLQAWYRADEGVVADSNNNVSQWTDLSGNGVHVVQPNSGQQPQLTPQAMNGQPALAFNGGQTELNTAGLTNLFQGSNDLSMFIVLNPGSSQTSQATLLSYNNFFWFQSNSDTNQYTNSWFGTDSSWYGSDPVTAAAGVPQVLEVVKGGPDEKTYINGALEDDTSYWWSSAPLQASAWTLAVGNRTNELSGFDGQMAEILVYNRALSDSERQALEAQLIAKYLSRSATPVISSSTSSSGTVGTTFNYQIVATNSPTSFAAAGLPAGLTLNSSTGLISGTPTVAGTTSITLSATNTSGSGTATLTVAIAPNFAVANGLLLWLHADAGVVADGSGNVSQWTDQSGAGNNAVLVSGATSPLLVANQVNGLPVIRFNGADALSLPANMMQGAQAGEIIAVVKINNPASRNTLWNYGTALGTTYNGTTHYDDFGTSDSTGLALETLAQISQYFVYDTSIDSGGNLTYRFNGTALWTRLGLSVGFQASPDIGGTGTGNLSADISEILVYNRVLTSTEQNAIYGYVASRYAMPAVAAAIGSPAVTSAANATGQVGQSFSYQITATNNPISFGASGLPGGLSVSSSGLISGTPTTNGNFTVTVGASNASGSGSSPLTIAVAVGPPEITSSASATAEVGVPFTYQIVATETPTGFGATGLPSGLSVDPVAGVISGTPTTAGTGTITLSASNSAGAGSATLTVTILAAPPTGAVLWLRADAGVVSNGSGNISTWQDQSGKGNNATQNSSNDRPLLVQNALNGLPAVQFTAANSQSMGLPNFLNGATAGEVFVVLKAANATPSANRALWGFGPSSSDRFPNTSGNITESFGSSVEYGVGHPPVPLTQYNLYNVSAQSGLWTARIDGVTLATETTNSFGSSGNPVIGQDGSAFFDGEIAEVIVYGSVLSAAQRTTVEQYLQAKYALPGISVPGNPSGLTATAISSTQASLTWTDAPTSTAISYTIWRQTGTGGSFTAIAQVNNGLSYIDTGLSANTSYSYKISSSTFAGSSPGFSNVATTTPAVGGTDMPLTGMKLWLKADTGVQANSSGSIVQWQDEGGSGNNATQTTVANEPVLVEDVFNGLPTVQFAAAGSQSLGLPNFLNGATAGEVFVVLKAANATPSASRALWGFGPSSSDRFPNTSGNITESFGSSVEYGVGHPPVPLTQYNLYNVSAQSGLWTARIDGVTLATETTNSFGSTGNPVIGQDGSSFFDGDVAEVIVYGSVLSAAQRATVEQYLQAKYALPGISIPANPSGLTVTAISSTQASLTWTDAPTSTAISYTIWRQTGTSSFVAIAQVNNGLSYIDTGLSAGTSYSYEISSSTFAGSSPGFSNVATTTPAVGGTDMPLTGMKLWLKADTGVQANSSGNIVQWQDEGGSGNNATQTTVANEPVLVEDALNGLPIVQFTAASSQALGLPNFLNGATAGEVFVVLKAASAAPSANRGLWGFGPSTSDRFPNTSGNITESFGSSVEYGIGHPSVPLTQYNLYNVSAQSGLWTARMDGVTFATETTNSFGSSNNPTIGQDGSAFFDGDVAEVIVYGSVLSAAQRATVEKYIQEKYNLPIIETPNNPTSLVAFASSPTQVSLQWNDTSYTETTYTIWRQTGSGSFAAVGQVSNSLSYMDSGLSPGTSYSYEISSSTPAGSSPGFSNTAVATTLASGTNFPLSGMSLWLKADSGIQATSSGQISQWQDQGGAGNNATQFTVANEPLAVANALGTRPAVQFSASNSQSLNLPNLMNGVTAGEVFVVVKAASVAPSANRGLWGFGPSTSDRFPNTSGHITESFGSSIDYDLGVPPVPLNQYNLYNVTAQTGLWTARMNGVTFATETTNTVGFSNNAQLGQNGSTFFDGDMAEVIIYPRALTAQERGVVSQYFEQRYGLSDFAPGPVLNLGAQAVSWTQVNLSWTEEFTGPGYSYTLERQSGSGGFQVIAEIPNNLTYTDSNLTPGTTYSYRIRAHDVTNDNGYGDYSNTASATTQPLLLTMPESGIQMWLTPGSIEPGPSGAQSVQTWHDVSGNGNDATQLSPASQPQLSSTPLNGQSVVHFNGSSSYLALPFSMGGAAAADMFVVLRSQPISGTDSGAMALSGRLLYPAANGQIDDSFSSTNDHSFAATGVDLTQAHIYNVTSANNQWTAHLDTQVLYTSTSNVLNLGTGTPQPVIGASYNSALTQLASWFTGDIAEIIVYNRVLSDQERQNATQQLASKYGLPISFPGDTNNNGIPDAFELQYFGAIDVNPNIDYDGNGLTAAQDYVAGYNPVDITNGRPFVILPLLQNTYTYDNSGRLITASYSNGSHQIFTMDSAGNLLGATNTGAIVQWRIAEGLPPDGTGVGADTYILSNDSLPNLAKYAFGLNPNVAFVGFCPVVTLVNGYLTLTYTRPDPASPDIAYTPQVSADGIHWSSGPGATISVSTVVANGIATVTVQDATHVGSPAFGRQIRLLIQRIPQP